MHRVAIFLLVTITSSCQSSYDPPLLIATAANMQSPMKALIKEFERQRGVKCDLSVASSGKLSTQILNGAPFDIFVSADTAYPVQLFKEQLTLGKPKIYAYGRLCLCTTKPLDKIAFSPSTLAGIDKIAIANPDIAPYGKAALEALEKVYPDHESKLIYGESIGQTALFIKSGAAEVGILAKSMQKSIEEDNGKCLDIEPSLYTPIAQAVVILKGSKQKDAAFEFQQFLISDSGKLILNKFGYSQ